MLSLADGTEQQSAWVLEVVTAYLGVLARSDSTAAFAHLLRDVVDMLRFLDGRYLLSGMVKILRTPRANVWAWAGVEELL